MRKLCELTERLIVQVFALMRLAVIPARGGSKRIPRKNIKLFCGKPMIGWSIEAAIGSGCFDRVIVSTDDDQIASVALQYGAEVPFVRPPELSDDHAGMRAVNRHAREWLQAHDARPITLFATLLATAPFVTPQRIRDLIAVLLASQKRRAFLATEFPYPIFRGFGLDKAGSPEMVFPEHLSTRSQDLPDTYHDAGQLYVSKIYGDEHDDKPFLGSDSQPVMLPRHLVVDIDTAEDWLRAEIMMEVLQRAGELA